MDLFWSWNFTRCGHIKVEINISVFRAVNNELLDTYQLKSLDGLVEGRLEEIAVVRREKDGGKRRTAKKRSKKSTEGKEQLYLTLTDFLTRMATIFQRSLGKICLVTTLITSHSDSRMTGWSDAWASVLTSPFLMGKINSWIYEYAKQLIIYTHLLESLEQSFFKMLYFSKIL